jgi:hypothetical protein
MGNQERERESRRSRRGGGRTNDRGLGSALIAGRLGVGITDGGGERGGVGGAEIEVADNTHGKLS